MTTYSIQENGITSLTSISGKEDLNPRPGININAPRGYCQCCGKSLEELKPFVLPGHPYDGALLVKSFRTAGYLTEELSIIEKRFFGNCETNDDYVKAKELLIKEFGAEEAEKLDMAFAAADCVGSSWECVDCIGLDMREYFEKLSES